MQLLKGFYWTLNRAVERDQEVGKFKEIFTLAIWLCSNSPYAIASRYGMLHYFSRKFGMMPSVLKTRIGSVGGHAGKPFLEP